MGSCIDLHFVSHLVAKTKKGLAPNWLTPSCLFEAKISMNIIFQD